MKTALYFADDHIRHTFILLQSGRAEDTEVVNQLNAAFDTITRDPFCGIQVPKRLIPKVYITDFAPLKNSKQTLNFSRKKLKYIS